MCHDLLTQVYQVKRLSYTQSEPEIEVREMTGIKTEGTVQRSWGKQACSKKHVQGLWSQGQIIRGLPSPTQELGYYPDFTRNILESLKLVNQGGDITRNKESTHEGSNGYQEEK